MSQHIGITFNEFQSQVPRNLQLSAIVNRLQMSQQWRSLSEEEKYPYIARERAEKAEHMFRAMMNMSNEQCTPEMLMHIEGIRAAAVADTRNPIAAVEHPQNYTFVRSDEFHRCVAVGCISSEQGSA